MQEGVVAPAGLVLTYLVENHKQIGFVPHPGNFIVTAALVEAFDVSPAWVDATLGRVPGAKRHTTAKYQTEGWLDVGEWHAPPGRFFLINADQGQH